MKRIRFGEEEQVVEAVDSITTANVLMLLSRGGGGGGEETDAFSPAAAAAAQAASRVFECKTCSRKFPSFQALGGHRASHKKPRPAADGIGPNGPADGPNGPAKARVHECSICGLEFAIGQALGGHMRRHRAAAAAAAEAEAEAEKKPEEGKRMLWVDLNLTPLENDMEYCRKSNLGLKIVDNIPMVGCLH